MEKELIKEHYVPMAELRKVKLVSELQSMLDQHRDNNEPEHEGGQSIPIPIPNLNRPPRHMGIGPDSIAGRSASPSPTLSIESEPKRRERAPSIDEQEAIKSLLMVGPRVSDAKALAAGSGVPLSSVPSHVTPLQCVRRVNTTLDFHQAGAHIEPRLKTMTAVSPSRVHTASILAGKFAGREPVKLLEPADPKREQVKSKHEEEPTNRIGVYSPRSRKELLAKFHDKRNKRMWKRKVRYGCRKSFANNRVREHGRFVKKKEDDPSSYLKDVPIKCEDQDEENQGTDNREHEHQDRDVTMLDTVMENKKNVARGKVLPACLRLKGKCIVKQEPA